MGLVVYVQLCGVLFRRKNTYELTLAKSVLAGHNLLWNAK
jgi:hypothetical protein